MYIYDYTAYCVHVSSIASVNLTGDNAEVGWSDIATGLADCRTTGDNEPHMLTAYLDMGAFVCHQHDALTPNQSDDFSVWGDSSDQWTWARNGMNVFTAKLDFRLSISVTNGERHSSYESAEALFNGMQNGTSPNWHDWTQSACYITNQDTTYHVQLHSATDISVSQGSQQC
jgi:hypothetical protein